MALTAWDRKRQLDLFGGLPPHVNGSDTSKEAAEEIQESSHSLRSKIMEYVLKSRFATCDEVEDKLKMRHQTASARIRELVLLGKLKDSGLRRKTRSGRSAAVYECSNNPELRQEPEGLE